jgi:hypothetical protein
VPVQPAAVVQLGREEAKQLDESINSKLRDAAANLAKSLIEVGSDLRRMQVSQGWKALGFNTWTEYLSAKRQFGRTYMFLLARIGQIEPESLKKFIDRGLGGSQLIEYAKVAPPKLVPQVIEATWEQVQDSPIREMRQEVKKQAASIVPRRTGPKKGGRRASPPIEKFKKLFSAVPVRERESFLSDLKAFLAESLASAKAEHNAHSAKK